MNGFKDRMKDTLEEAMVKSGGAIALATISGCVRCKSFIWKDERIPKVWELGMHVGNWFMSHRSDGDVAGDHAVPKKEKRDVLHDLSVK